MVLKRFRGMGRNSMDESMPQEEYIEIEVGGASKSSPVPAHGKIGIRIENLTEFSETEKVLRFLREGSVVLLKIKTLKEKDLSELKRVVERLKRTIAAQNGDMVGVEQDWLLLVPEHAVVHR